MKQLAEQHAPSPHHGSKRLVIGHRRAAGPATHHRWLERYSPATLTWVAHQAARGAAALLSGLPTCAATLAAALAGVLAVPGALRRGRWPSRNGLRRASGWRQASVLAFYPGLAGVSIMTVFGPGQGAMRSTIMPAGTPQTQDRLVYQRPDHPTWHYAPAVTADGRYLVISVLHASELRNLLLVVDLACPDAAACCSARPLPGVTT